LHSRHSIEPSEFKPAAICTREKGTEGRKKVSKNIIDRSENSGDDFWLNLIKITKKKKKKKKKKDGTGRKTKRREMREKKK
jgi:hypothetical protein